MKFLMIIAVTSMSISSWAKTTVTIPLMDESETKIIEKITVDNTEESIQKAHDYYWKISDEKEIGSESAPGLWYKKAQTCYSGDPKEAVEILGSLGDGIYSDQLGLWGWKYRGKTFWDEYLQDDQDSQKLLATESKLWREWDASGTDILIVSHVGDDGDDILEGIIKKCSAN